MGFFSKVFKKIKNVVVKVATVAAPVLTVAAPFLAPISATLSTVASVGAKVAGGINTIGTLSRVVSGKTSANVAAAQIQQNAGNGEAANAAAAAAAQNAQVNVENILKNIVPTNLTDSNAQLIATVQANQQLGTELEKQMKLAADAVASREDQKADILAAEQRIAAANASGGSGDLMLFAVAGIGLFLIMQRSK